MRLHACFIEHGIEVRSEIVYLCCGFFKFWVFINGICSIKFGHTLPHEIPKSSQTTNLNWICFTCETVKYIIYTKTYTIRKNPKLYRVAWGEPHFISLGEPQHHIFQKNKHTKLKQHGFIFWFVLVKSFNHRDSIESILNGFWKFSLQIVFWIYQPEI